MFPGKLYNVVTTPPPKIAWQSYLSGFLFAYPRRTVRTKEMFQATKNVIQRQEFIIGRPEQTGKNKLKTSKTFIAFGSWERGKKMKTT